MIVFTHIQGPIKHNTTDLNKILYAVIFLAHNPINITI